MIQSSVKERKNCLGEKMKNNKKGKLLNWLFCCPHTHIDRYTLDFTLSSFYANNMTLDFHKFYLKLGIDFVAGEKIS